MTILCTLEELKKTASGGPVLKGKKIISLYRDGQVFLYTNICPHTGLPLEFVPDQFLDITGQFIQCSNHGALFDIKTGECLYGPCKGRALTRVAFEIRDGAIVPGPDGIPQHPGQPFDTHQES